MPYSSVLLWNFFFFFFFYSLFNVIYDGYFYGFGLGLSDYDYAPP